jgi:hypothetical protein
MGRLAKIAVTAPSSMTEMSKHSKHIASELSKFKDRDAEYQETGDPSADRKRREAMGELSPENYHRAHDVIDRRIWAERDRRADLLRRVKFSGFTRKD